MESPAVEELDGLICSILQARHGSLEVHPVDSVKINPNVLRCLCEAAIEDLAPCSLCLAASKASATGDPLPPLSEV
eukprot:CAMPEP_0179196954 /NCGR_PEP_ID=MMETSP0796-20121207/97941_1 /TAXON_ID=73915 /ORGANISM="Pyrodinium bahamense, Strain pbaha01" /LENGTH=75 /DNA_ID=CAMNT_0020901371 /DNA_START=156 /DNA_END=384 /DNA_ORIENTATION=+